MADASSHSVFNTSADNSPASNPNFLLINPANQITAVKLTDENYLLWNLQILAGIRGLGLESYISDPTSIPPRITSSEAINPDFIIWCRQDQLLLSFLLASMSESVQAQMIGCASSVQLWNRVATIFATRSKARVMQYKLQLQTLKKGGLSMKDYIGKMKSYMDTLVACGHLISDEDQILYILGGVGWNMTL